MVWDSSTRRARLPIDWAKRRELVKQRAGGMCQAKHHAPDCDGIGSECDHIRQGDDHSLNNLQWLSTPCHKAKTIADRPTRTRPPEQHPGRLA